jgi:hypothetical protein
LVLLAQMLAQLFTLLTSDGGGCEIGSKVKCDDWKTFKLAKAEPTWYKVDFAVKRQDETSCAIAGDCY